MACPQGQRTRGGQVEVEGRVGSKQAGDRQHPSSQAAKGEEEARSRAIHTAAPPAAAAPREAPVRGQPAVDGGAARVILAGRADTVPD